MEKLDSALYQRIKLNTIYFNFHFSYLLTFYKPKNIKTKPSTKVKTFKVGHHLYFLKLFNTKKHLAWTLKKVVHLFFCVFQTKLKKAVIIFCTLP